MLLVKVEMCTAKVASREVMVGCNRDAPSV
jgi:hypothetical protein